MNKIRKGDQVIILTGRDKGKHGAVLQRVDEDRIVVEGVNVVKKHVKPNPMNGTTGGVTVPRLPLSRPVNTMTWSPLRILFMACPVCLVGSEGLRALRVRATQFS